MSTPEQPASDAAKPSDEAVKAAHGINFVHAARGFVHSHPVFWKAPVVTDVQMARIIDRETKLPDLRAQLAAQQAALSAAKEVIETVWNYAGAGLAVGQTHGAVNWRDALEAIHAKAHAALAQIRALGDT